MSDWFGEKTQQISTSSLIAFGINLVSRYGKASEMKQMLDFAQRAAVAGVESFIDEVFYDTKSCCCSFKFRGEVEEHDLVAAILLGIGKETISQFDWFGYVEHGGDNLKEE
jgi:hypothetical protein